MEADAPLGQKTPKYDEAVLQNLEEDRQTERVYSSQICHISQLCETAGPKKKKNKSVNLLS